MASQKPTLRELFEAASDLPRDERARYLDAHCDAELRARIESMLASEPGPEGALPGIAATAFVDVLADSEVTPMPLSGTHIGPFELLGVLGEGGSSTVFHAVREIDGVRQDVALKLLRRGLHSVEAKRQFRRERIALSRLQHPGIARLIEGGVTENGFAYIVLELVRGTSITEYARAHRLDAPARLRIFLDVCRAVDAAHRALIVHRDLKPSNVLVTAEGEMKLLDFGIAKLLGEDDETHTRLPAFTPAYASPEQRADGLITTATDVYALGVLLGELMTGERLGEGPSRTPSACITDGHETGVLPAAPAATRRLLKGDLDNIVLKALEIDPVRRYASAGYMADDVGRLLDGRPVTAHPPSRWYRTSKFVSRHRGGVATAFLSLLAILSALGIALWQADAARHQALLAHAQAERADMIGQFLVGVFDHAEPDANLGQAISARQLLEGGERELAASATTMQADTRLDLSVLIAHLYWDLGDVASAQPLLDQSLAALARADVPDALRARTLAAIAKVESDKRVFDAAIEHANQALEIARHIGPAGFDTVSEARRVLAASLHGKDDSRAAEPILREALADDRAHYGDRHQTVVDDGIALGNVLTELSRFDEAIPILRETVDRARVVHGPVHSSVANALQELSGALAYSSDYAGSERAAREAVDIDEKVYGPEHNETMIARSNLSWSLERHGRYAQALRSRLDMMPLLERVSATRPETLASAYTSVGQDYAKLGRFDEAEAALRKVLGIWAKLQGSNDEWDSADPMVGLAEALRWHGRYDEAEAFMRRAIAIQQKHEPADSGWLNSDRAALGDMLRQQGRYGEALREITAAADARRGAKADPLLSVLLAQLSQAQLDAGDANAALATATRSVGMARTLFKSGQASLGTPLFALARAELALGHADKAEPLLREAISVRSPPNPVGDPRVLEIQVALVSALDALGREGEARTLREAIEPFLKASASPYVASLRQRLNSPDSNRRTGPAMH